MTVYGKDGKTWVVLLSPATWRVLLAPPGAAALTGGDDASAAAGDRDAPVFPSRRGGGPLDQPQAWRLVRAAAARVGLPAGKGGVAPCAPPRRGTGDGQGRPLPLRGIRALHPPHLPGSVLAYPAGGPGAGEILYYLPAHRALFAGDGNVPARLLGCGAVRRPAAVGGAGGGAGPDHPGPQPALQPDGGPPGAAPRRRPCLAPGAGQAGPAPSGGWPRRAWRERVAARHECEPWVLQPGRRCTRGRSPSTRSW